MTIEQHPEPDKPITSARVKQREARLKAALKANMAKRKAQARAKADGPQTGGSQTDDTTAGVTGPGNDME